MPGLGGAAGVPGVGRAMPMGRGMPPMPPGMPPMPPGVMPPRGAMPPGIPPNVMMGGRGGLFFKIEFYALITFFFKSKTFVFI